MNYHLEAGFGRKSFKISNRGLMFGFALGWGLLTFLVAFQDRAIQNQRELIQLLMEDLHSSLITTVSHGNNGSVPVVVREVQLPSKQVQKQSVETPSHQVQSQPSPKVQPNTKGSSRPPSSQAKNADANTRRSSREAIKALPVKPPAQYTDPSDMRRVMFSI